MNSDDHRDQLIDMLLRELVGGETPPDVRERVLDAAGKLSARPAIRRHRVPARRVIPVRPPSRSRAPMFAMAALLAVLAVAAGFVHFREIAGARTPAVTRISGSVDRSAATLRPGESVSTGAQSSAVLTYPDGTVVELAAETILRVSARSWGDRSKGLDLVTGRIRAEVAPQVPRDPMVLTSGNASAEVVGTKLSFQHDDERTRLEVTEGAVRFIPRKGGPALLVNSGLFAEVTESGVRSGAITAAPRRGILRFTLMNAETDQPIREEALVDGETISLASLPTREINIRADFEGEPPSIVKLILTRDDGETTGLPPHASDDQKHPPFFVAGDYWPEGRPDDCRSWTPRPGRYQLSAETFYDENGEQDRAESLKIRFQIVD